MQRVVLLWLLILVACSQPAAPTPMAGMDHAMGHGSEAPYDALFIDSMIEHHEGAITMAQQVLQESRDERIRQLAEAILATQAAEIDQMRQWRQAWYPDVPPTGGMGMEMGPMAVPDGDGPFDRRFLEAMIPHHEGAVAMARDALQKAEHAEIRELAQAIITAQEAEIVQMKQWLAEFGR
ncbi:MAG: hypothetical protein KatS3mg055_0036 [Chloroflexus sp.]|uniref:DUF305 domain-containing protein n=1 Tax=Chloroflexus sp. TaxID=1904827 RepID=UPI0021DC5B46|nr:DUF305 domain-containing protein [Chloroflexus sp.]GIV87518.1 MAG: hypothetical protein KatS3mg055_0036 [Chloroflexus sp.]